MTERFQKVSSVSALTPAFSETSTCQFGTLSHSTLVVGLLCLLSGAVWELFSEHKDKGLKLMQTGDAGAWNSVALAKAHPRMADVFRDGILFEVLSWRIMLDEPEGTCAKISHAINEAQAVAMTTHEMEALSTVTTVVNDLVKGAAVAGQVDFEEVKGFVKTRLPQYVNDAHFQDMFTFVINTGAKAGKFIDRLLEYDRRYVDHKKRTLPLSAFVSVNLLAAEFPRTKVALLMRAYSKPPNKGVCPIPEAKWGQYKSDQTSFLFPSDAELRSHGARR